MSTSPPHMDLYDPSTAACSRSTSPLLHHSDAQSAAHASAAAAGSTDVLHRRSSAASISIASHTKRAASSCMLIFPGGRPGHLHIRGVSGSAAARGDEILSRSSSVQLQQLPAAAGRCSIKRPAAACLSDLQANATVLSSQRAGTSKFMKRLMQQCAGADAAAAADLRQSGFVRRLAEIAQLEQEAASAAVAVREKASAQVSAGAAATVTLQPHESTVLCGLHCSSDGCDTGCAPCAKRGL